MTEGSFKGIDGIKIFTREWQPAGKPHAVVVISHGFNAHSGQYEWVAQQFVSKGLAVYALDHRGRGRSGGERFFVKKFADWTSDLATLLGQAVPFYIDFYASSGRDDGAAMHDPLALAAAIDPSLCGWTDTRVQVKHLQPLVLLDKLLSYSFMFCVRKMSCRLA